MIIDFHTHAFPEKIASRALNILKDKINIEPFTDGTVEGLINKMDQWGVDTSVICNIATNPRQQKNVNDFAIDSLKHSPRIIPLGSINPESDNVEAELERLKSNGIKGIKIHPDYMGHDIDERIFDPVFDVCASHDMFVITHAGFDVCSPDHIHATPDMILRVINRHPGLKLIAAHNGGNFMYDEVLEKLCGKEVWIDTSFAIKRPGDDDLIREVLLSHDSDKILFGSDTPWASPRTTADFLEDLGLSSAFLDKIFEKNARLLLQI